MAAREGRDAFLSTHPWPPLDNASPSRWDRVGHVWGARSPRVGVVIRMNEQRHAVSLPHAGSRAGMPHTVSSLWSETGHR
jgi:hypothetical protein